ncbi:unnamed protein product [Symbiodinium natans]|uniref:Uncharacterized protein n=1 Tax=Symbiodinium natans TaxID=878477 RepID=A0A812U4J6_9DINO|nr:unnamed protein product [Symbiodinium natans]
MGMTWPQAAPSRQWLRRPELASGGLAEDLRQHSASFENSRERKGNRWKNALQVLQGAEPWWLTHRYPAPWMLQDKLGLSRREVDCLMAAAVWMHVKDSQDSERSCMSFPKIGRALT